MTNPAKGWMAKKIIGELTPTLEHSRGRTGSNPGLHNQHLGQCYRDPDAREPELPAPSRDGDIV